MKKNRYKDKSICKNIEQTILKQKATNVLLYLPMSIEVDIYKLLEKLKKIRTKNVFVPYISGGDMSVAVYRLPTRKTKYGLRQPNRSGIKPKIHTAVVPVVAYDITNRRIGFGKGYYDRFFANMKTKPYIIFVQRVDCQAKGIVTNIFDIKANKIITKGKR